ncbi:phosphodiester glycosidase family protein [Candidatus Woesebacteria bacterium]|nr:MAG: phosphodiester glycosidase family protein [Candidatus Woesebacteria bacterium]
MKTTRLPGITFPKPTILRKIDFKIVSIALLSFIVTFLGASYYFSYTNSNSIKASLSKSLQNENDYKVSLENISQELENLKTQDQIKRNEELNATIKSMEISYDTAVSVYENLLKLKDKTETDDKLDDLFTSSLTLLSERKYSEANEKLKELTKNIDEVEAKIAAAAQPTIPANIASSNTPPGTGYSRQSVTTDVGTFVVSMVAADIGSTRVIVDTASEGDCGNDCPVLSLADYVSRNGAFAGINGTYFCPASYPSCAGKTNTFDLLVMNKNKYYFNSGNNVYSNNPAVIFGNGYVRFVSSASQWGRDTSVDGVISNYPLTLLNGNITFGGDDDPKKGSRGARSFVANKGNTVYIGVASGVTVAESAHVMKSLGMENAMNLDSGGSTALWSSGYKAGPGRNIPNAILFVKR